MSIDPGVNDNRDWSMEEMLDKAKQYVQQQEQHHPLGLVGGMVLFWHTPDRELDAIKANKKEDKCNLYFICGLDIEKQIMLLARTRFNIEEDYYLQRLDRKVDKEEE